MLKVEKTAFGLRIILIHIGNYGTKMESFTAFLSVMEKIKIKFVLLGNTLMENLLERGIISRTMEYPRIKFMTL